MKLFLILFCVAFSLIITQNVIVHAQTGEKKISLNGIWNFRIDPSNSGNSEQWYSLGMNPAGWDKMKVPGNWDTKDQYSDYAGKAWYHRTFDIADELQGKSVFLQFGGVYFDSKVWLNGQLLGSNNNGFLPFEYEITKLLKPRGNSLVVCADNFFRLGAVWNWGGIRRDVNILIANQVRILRQHITPDVDLSKRTAIVNVKVFISNTSDQPKNIQGAVLLGKGGLLDRKIPFSASLPAHSTTEINLKTDLKPSEVHLWHFDDPFLYNSTITVSSGNEILHQIKDRFGLRKVEVDHLNYTFKLNGEPVRLMGLNLVPDDRTTGNTLPLWRIKEDIDMMKELGSNMTRISHLPLPEEMYDYLDEKGMMVFPEVSLWGFSDKVDPANPVSKEWLERMVTEFYNHPSIIGWSVGNEIGMNPKIMEYAESAIKHAKNLDPGRLAVIVSHTAHNPQDAIEFSDLGMINKYGKNLGPVTRLQHQMHPQKLLFYSEYGEKQLSEDLNSNLDAKGALDSLRFKPYLMGAAIWTFNDYRSGFYDTKELSQNRPWGVVDVFRQKKRAWASLRKEYAPVQNFEVRPGQDLQGKTSAEIIITPRTSLDIPAFALRKYKLIWNLKDGKGNVIHGGFRDLPVIKPGDQSYRSIINWEAGSNPHTLEVSLNNPLNYTALDTIIFFQKPQLPEIISVQGFRANLRPGNGKQGAIRVSFKKDLSATEYKLKYGKELSSETLPSINHFIEIQDLDPEQKYDLALVAINSFGESDPVIIPRQAIDFIPGPPVIRYTEPSDSGFFVGYSNQNVDYMMEIQISSIRGDYGSAKVILSRNKGVLGVSELNNGHKYYYRLRRINQDQVAGAWSEEIEVVPDGDQLPETPKIQGVFKQGNEAVVLFVPLKKSTGYRLRYRHNKMNEWICKDISSAAVKYYTISGLVNAKYEFQLAAVNQYGTSEFSSSIFSTNE